MNCKDIAELAPLYLSGEISGAIYASQHDRFHAHLAECRNCTAQLERQVALDTRLRDAFSSELPDASTLEQSVRARIARDRSRRWTLVAASAAAVLFAALLGYRMLQPDRLFPDRLFYDAARDHRMEVVEHQPRRWRTDPADIGKLTARYGLSNLSLIAPAGYRLERAKMCGLDGAAALHLVYTNGAQEFSFYVRTRTGAADGLLAKSLRTKSVGSENLARFQTDRLEAVIVTAGSSEECLQFAHIAAGVLSS